MSRKTPLTDARCMDPRCGSPMMQLANGSLVCSALAHIALWRRREGSQQTTTHDNPRMIGGRQ